MANGIGFSIGEYPLPPRWVGLTMVLILMSMMICLPASSMEPLHGSASYIENSEVPWLPYTAALYRTHQPLILKADTLVGNYKLEAAKSLYRQALNQDPRNAGAWNGLGKVAYFQTTSSNQNLRDKTEALYDEAIQDFLSALRYQPGYVEAHLNLASVYMEQGRMGEAGDEINRAWSLAPHNDEVLAKKGEWLVRQGQANDALPYLQAAIKRNSANVSAHYYLAVAQTNRNELDAALQNLNTTLWLQPLNASAQYQMGLIYQQQGNGAAAIEHYLKAISIKPELKTARLKLADYYEQRGDTTATLEQLKSVVDAGDGNWALIDRIGHLSVQNNQANVAVKYYREWLDDHPDDQAKASAGLSFAKTQLARQKLRDDDLISKGDAKYDADQALQYQPNNFEARLISAKLDREIGAPSPISGRDPGMVDVSLQQSVYQPYQAFEKGELLLARYQFSKAEQSFRIARRTGEGNRNQMVFGELFLAKGLPSLAEEAFQWVLAQLPGNISAQLGLAKVAQARNDSLELLNEARQNAHKKSLPVAIMQLEKALKANIENAEAHYLLAKLYERNDEYGPAADHYYAYLQLEPQADNADSTRHKIEELKQKLVRQRSEGQL
jgi:tetratricopeptide (TPR) repeat protein